MHSGCEHRAVLTNATGYIVVFKKTASEEEKEDWRRAIRKGSEYLILCIGPKFSSQGVRNCRRWPGDARIYDRA
jgi:hypothetical protein